MPTPEKLAEILTLHSFEVEEVKRVGKDWILDIDVLPNRAPDCFSHLGIARECAVLTNSKFQIPDSEIKENKNLKAKDFIGVEVENKEDCPRYTAKVILGVKVKSSPKWIQERLKVCGLEPINNIVDITNYVMLETGQPIHAFDLDKIKSLNPKSQIQKKKIIVRRTKKGEKITALDDKTYTLDKDILLIADAEKPIAIAGIKGGESTGIDNKTKNIIIEAANFNPRVIRKASRKLKLKTDASWRFENGIDLNLIDFAQKRVCSLVQKIADGKIVGGMVDFYPKKIRPKKVKLDLKYVERLLGVNISESKVIRILKSLGLKIENCKLKILTVEVPTRRLDVSIQEDLIEEIGRIYGYENIPLVFPQAALIPPEKNEELFWQKNVKDILKETGFSEIYNYSFIGEKDISIYQFWQRKSAVVELENPISSFNRYLRPSLIPNLLKNVKENLKFFDEIKIFEIGKTFKKSQASNRKSQILEKKMLGGVLTRKGIGNEGFYELKGVVELLLNKLGISNVWFDDYQQTPEESHFGIWHPKKSAEIKIDGKEIGFLGEIHPNILEQLKIAEKVFVFDLNFEKLKKFACEEHEYQPISVHPAAVRDLAVLVPLGTKTVEVLNIINAAGGKLVRDVDLFDVYSGEGIPEGKENFAFHIIYQAEDRTLSSREIDKVHQKIIKALEERPAWEVRK